MAAALSPGTAPEATARRGALVPLAKGPVSLIAAGVGVVLSLTSDRYGYNADELYFVAAGHHLSWGYADQPPLVPLIAGVLDTVFPDSLVALRVPPMLLTVAGVILAALIAREFGGDRRAQVLTAGASAVSTQLVSAGHLFATWSFDPFLWTLITWLLVRWTRLHAEGRTDDRLLLSAAVVTACALLVKLLVLVFWFCLGLAVLAVGPRALLWRRSLWLGAAVAVVALIPTLGWQSANDWPLLSMPGRVAVENGHGWVLFLPAALTAAGVVGAFLACYGLWRLLRSPALRPYRFLGWTSVGVTAVFLVTGGRHYYVAGLFGLLFAVGTVELQRRREASGPSRWRWITWPAYAASACVALATLPILPSSRVPSIDGFGRSSIGWPQLTSIVADAYRGLPPEQRRRTAIVTHDYWSASALEHYGAARGISGVYSGSRGFWYFGAPPADTERVLYLGGNREYLLRFFRDVRQVTTVDTHVPPGTYYEGTPIWLAENPIQPWSELWPRFGRMGLFDGSIGASTQLPGADAG